MYKVHNFCKKYKFEIAKSTICFELSFLDCEAEGQLKTPMLSDKDVRTRYFALLVQNDFLHLLCCSSL